jgi:hypothetical protein
MLNPGLLVVVHNTRRVSATNTTTYHQSMSSYATLQVIEQITSMKSFFGIYQDNFQPTPVAIVYHIQGVIEENNFLWLNLEVLGVLCCLLGCHLSVPWGCRL